MSVVAITVDGVMRKIVGMAPIPAGIKLYRALATQFSVVLVTDELEDYGHLSRWLETEGLNEHTGIVWSNVVLDSYDTALRRVRQMTMVRVHGAVELVVEPDPAISALLIQEGLNVMTMSYAAYSQPSWRPDYIDAVRPWDELSKQVADAARLRANDRRLEQQEIM